MRSNFRGGAAVLLWAAAVGTGFWAWGNYDATPGPTGVPEQDAGFTSGDGRKPWTLTLYAHPECPCTRASITAVEELAAAFPGTLDARVVSVDDARSGAGREARRAGALTSGLAVLADRSGHVAFRGGLTPGRGRAGDSVGRRAVRAVMRGEEPEARSAPAFGCALFAPGALPFDPDLSGVPER